MQYLSKNKEDKHKYIVSVIDNGDTFSIKFADGTIYDGYAKTEENLNTVSDAMEAQAEEATELEGYYKGLVGLNATATIAGTTAGAYAVQLLGTALCDTFSSVSPEHVATATGITIGAGTLIGLKHIMVNARKIAEIKKFKLRDSMREDLDRIEEYPHALTGVRSRVQELVNSFANPFSAINSESYTTKDLIKISQNVEREKVYQLKSVK
ncbi:MAG: hypothetical protein PUA97_02985 [bacterium]|nr:hypothetical protein [bacterium]